MRIGTALLATLLAALAGCACDTVPAEAIEDCETSHVVPLAVATDILFVIDDSTSMGGEQVLLQNGLASFIQTLDASPVKDVFQIGVTTSAVEDFDGTPFPPAGDLVGAGIMPASSPTLVPDFQATVLVGTAGSNREEPFAAVRLALAKSGPGGANEGFLRPGARLAIIFLSDEDDCSGPLDTGSTPIANSQDCREEKADPASTLVPVADLVGFLAGPVAGEVRDVVVAAVVGVAPGTLVLSCGLPHCADQTCSTATDQGDRFLALLAALGPGRTRLASICDESFDQALAEFANLILSQTLPLDGAPADWRLLVASIERAGVGTIGCVIAPFDAPPASRDAADAIYEPPQAGRPAALTFQNACTLREGDRVDVKVVCAG
jgi:hypothetical protein